MIVFPNAKINIGLYIARKRADGYHDLESVLYPVGLKDALELVENNTNKIFLTCSGIPVNVEPEKNIIVKAYRLLSSVVALPGLDIHLHKAIPHGAGLGGGSSDSAFFLKAVNDYFELKLTQEKLKSIALQLGADCSFFLENRPSLALGIGEILQPVDINLHGYYLILVKPPFGVVTSEAYAKIIPSIPEQPLIKNIHMKPEDWTGVIKNDFETSVFLKYPEIERIKDSLIEFGAVYASMSGSGSTVFGLFKSEPKIDSDAFGDDYFLWMELL